MFVFCYPEDLYKTEVNVTVLAASEFTFREMLPFPDIKQNVEDILTPLMSAQKKKDVEYRSSFMTR